MDLHFSWRGVLVVGIFAAAAPAASGAVSDAQIAALQARLDALAQQNAALQSQVNDLSKQQEAAWTATQRTAEIRQVVAEVLADAATRPAATAPKIGYDGGFFIQSADPDFRLVVGGLLQVRYTYTQSHANNAAFGGKPPLPQGDTQNSSGFDIRRARINLSGYAMSPQLFYRLEGDFYGGANGAFTVTDAYAGYAFSDLFKVQVGAFKTPFSKVELVSDALLELERPEENFPFDPVRTLGVSLFGDIIHDRLNFNVNMNDGAKTNTLRYIDDANSVTTITSTVSPTYNLDNRLAFYGRLQYSPTSIGAFYDGGEADMRSDNSAFIWMLGGAAGYESQNSSAAAFAQNTLSVVGLGSNNSPGFAKAYVLNGDIYRATADFSAKWRGLSINSAVYFQQINAEQYAGTVSGGLPYGVGKTSFNQSGYYAQLGYMLLPRRLELVARGGVILDEGDPNSATYYTLGAVYYLHGNGAKITADVDYSPETSYTDNATLQIANTRELTFRVQLQLKF